MKSKKPERKYLPTLAELIDRLAINTQKEIFITDKKKEYAQEIKEILHDIDMILQEEDVKLDADLIRTIMLVMFFNREIWINESAARSGTPENNNLYLSHSLNSLRNFCKNKIQERIGGRLDYKLDVLSAGDQWVPSW